MRFMMMVKADGQYEAGVPPAPELQAAMERLILEMASTGVLVDAGGLLPSSAGALVRCSGGRLSVHDGPFAETKELIGGYAILNAASHEEAIALGRRFMQLHADVLGPTYEGELEIRQMHADPRGEGY
jgi:hypothetical protein